MNNKKYCEGYMKSRKTLCVKCGRLVFNLNYHLKTSHVIINY